MTKLQNLYQQRDNNFGNGRLVRNLFERTIEKQASRLAKLTEINQESIVSIVAEDIP